MTSTKRTATEAARELNASDPLPGIFTIPAVERLVDAAPFGSISEAASDMEIVAHLLAVTGATHYSGAPVEADEFVSSQRAYIAGVYRTVAIGGAA